MKVRICSWLFPLIAASAFAQDPAPTVTLETKATTVHAVIESVVRQTGLKVEPGTLRDWPVIVRVKDMPAKTFLDHLAKVLDAEWERSGDTVTLKRGVNKVRIAEAAEAEARTPWVSKAVATFLQENAGGTDWSEAAIDKRLKEDAEKRRKALENIRGAGDNVRISLADSSSTTPGMLVLNEALRKLPPRLLASILPGQRVVWANTPNRMQKQLPYVPGSLESFIRAYNRLIAANKSLADTNTDTVRVDTPLSKRGEPIEAVSKLIVTAQRHGDGLQVSALIVGKGGDILDRPQAWLGEPPTATGTVPEGISGEATISELSKSLIRALQPDTPSNNQMQFEINLGDNLSGSLSNDPPLRVLPAGMAQILANPKENEPMSYFPSEVLLQLSQKLDRDLVAFVPDSAFIALIRKLGGGKIAFSDLYRNAPALGLQITDGPTILVSAANWAHAERTRVNRTELAKLTGAVATKGYATLDEVSRYALAMPRWANDNLDAAWLGATAPAEHRKYSANQNVFYKMYGTLTPPQKQPNSPRVNIMANQMSAQQKLLLEEIVYQPGGAQIIGNGRMMTTATVSAPGPGRGQEPVEPEIVLVEPTEAFPNGLPPNTRLELTRRFTDGVYATDSTGRGRFLSAGDLGLRMGIDKGSLPPGTTIDSNFSKFLLADLVVVEMNVQFGRRGRNASLRDASIRSAAAAMSYSQLPKAFTDNVDRARQRAMNMRTMSIGGGGNPPP